MDKSLKLEIEEFWGSRFSDVLKEHFDAKEVKVVEPIQDFPEHQRPDVLYEISYKSNKKDWTWAEITLVYPHNDAAKHVHQAAISGQRDTPGQQKSLDAILVKSALSDSFDRKGEPVLDPDRKMADLCEQGILRKMQKESYGHLCKKYGRGHLLVIIPYQTAPLVNRHTVQHVDSILSHTLLKQQCNFRSLWITHKQPEVDNLIIVHDPTTTLRYAFYSLWPEQKFYIVEIANQ